MKVSELEDETKEDLFKAKKNIAKEKIAISLKALEEASRGFEYCKNSYSKLLEQDIEDFQINQKSTNDCGPFSNLIWTQS